MFPVAFLYRHYLELRLKEIIQSGRRLLAEGQEFPHEHDLRKLWIIARTVLERLELAGGRSVLDSTGNLISQFCEVDPSSFAFRYPVDKSGRETLTQLGHVNLRNLKEVMGTVANFLDGASTAVSVDLDAKNEMLREWEP